MGSASWKPAWTVLVPLVPALKTFPPVSDTFFKPNGDETILPSYVCSSVEADADEHEVISWSAGSTDQRHGVSPPISDTGFLHQSASTHDQALTVDIRGGSRDGSIEENWANGDLSLHESIIPAMYPAACMICLARFQDPVMRTDPL